MLQVEYVVSHLHLSGSAVAFAYWMSPRVLALLVPLVVIRQMVTEVKQPQAWLLILR